MTKRFLIALGGLLSPYFFLGQVHAQADLGQLSEQLQSEAQACSKGDRSGCDAAQAIAHQILDAAEGAKKYAPPEMQEMLQKWIDEARDSIADNGSATENADVGTGDGNSMMDRDVHTAPAQPDDSQTPQQGGQSEQDPDSPG